jgi:copper(I)-binding protein
MKVFFKLVTSFLFLASAQTIWAQDFKAGTIVVERPHATVSMHGSKNGAFFFKSIKNSGKDADQLVSVKSQIADKTEIHEMKMDGDVMKMRALSAIEIPAGSVISVIKGNPSGYHVMLLGLKKPLKEGDKFSLWLSFKKAGEVEVEVVVQAPEAAVKHEEHKH